MASTMAVYTSAFSLPFCLDQCKLLVEHLDLSVIVLLGALGVLLDVHTRADVYLDMTGGEDASGKETLLSLVQGFHQRVGLGSASGLA